MVDTERVNTANVSLTVRVYVPEVDADMVPALRLLVLDVFEPYEGATVDVNMQAPRPTRQQRG